MPTSWAQVVDHESHDPIVSTIMAPSVVPCSCDCCQVAERLPSEVERLHNGRTLNHKCVRPGLTLAHDPGQCPGQCFLREAEVVLSAATTAVDLVRYCLYRCKPAVPTVGGMCLRLTPDEMGYSSSWDGNGRTYVAANDSDAAAQTEAQAAAVGESQASWQSVAEQRQAQLGEEANEAEGAREEQARASWDLRKLISERLRAEAGAAVARGAAAVERVRVNGHEVARNAALVTQVEQAMSSEESQVEGETVASEANATAAEEAAASTAIVLKEARMAAAAPRLLRETRRLTAQLMERDVAAAAMEEAEAYASRAGWDKPDNYPRLLSNRASEPYMRDMATAVQRVAEYERYAKGLSDQAWSLEAKAKGLEAQVVAAEARADAPGAGALEREVRTLRRRSRQLRSESEKFFKVAANTKRQVPKWQDAGTKVAAYVSQAYAAAKPPPV